MKLSVITWDACYRDFIHCIDSLSRQSLPYEDYELIIVEQFSEKLTKKFEIETSRISQINRVHDLAVTGYNISYYNVGLDNEIYNVGKLLNFGIERAQGEFIVVIDGDMLFDYDYLENCLLELNKNDSISSFRRMSQYPVQSSWREWKRSNLNLLALKNSSTQAFYPLFPRLTNFGQMLGYRKSDWLALGGYVEIDLFSTSWSKVHKDFALRLEKLNKTRIKIIRSFAYHPWHPILLDKDSNVNSKKEIAKMRLDLLSFQDRYIHASLSNNCLTSSCRKSNLMLNRLEKDSRELILFASNVWQSDRWNKAESFPKKSIRQLERAVRFSSFFSVLSIGIAEQIFNKIK